MANRGERKRPVATQDEASGFEYAAASSPQANSQQSIEDISKAIAELNRLTKSIEQKTSIFATSKDSRSNHTEVNTLIEKGKELSLQTQKNLESLSKGKHASGPAARTANALCRKLTHDYKAQVLAFEEVMKKAVAIETSSIDNIRRTSTRLGSSMGASVPNNMTNFSEDQVYSQAQVQEYDEDALQRREDDIVKITKQLEEVSQAYKKVDQIIVEQDEVVMNVLSDTEAARVDVQEGLEQINAANEKTSYCAFSKGKLICLAIFTAIVVILVLSLLAAFKAGV